MYMERGGRCVDKVKISERRREGWVEGGRGKEVQLGDFGDFKLSKQWVSLSETHTCLYVIQYTLLPNTEPSQTLFQLPE